LKAADSVTLSASFAGLLHAQARFDRSTQKAGGFNRSGHVLTL
jgi:hypothetical protein